MPIKLEKSEKALLSALAHAGVNHTQRNRIANAVNNVVQAHVEGNSRAEDVDAVLTEKDAEISRLNARLKALTDGISQIREELTDELGNNENIESGSIAESLAERAEEQCRALLMADQKEAKAAAQYDYGMRVDPKACDDGLPGSELLETIQEWSRLHDLNESVIAQKGTPSDSEIEFEVEAWTKIKNLASDIDVAIAAKVVESKAELKARFVALCNDYAKDAEPATSYRQAMEDLVEALENGDENLVQPEPFEALFVENDQVAELAELLFQSEYQDDAKKLAYPKAHFERMATEVLGYFKDNNPDADAFREKFLRADERAVKWRNHYQSLKMLRPDETIKINNDDCKVYHLYDPNFTGNGIVVSHTNLLKAIEDARDILDDYRKDAVNEGEWPNEVEDIKIIMAPSANDCEDAGIVIAQATALSDHNDGAEYFIALTDDAFNQEPDEINTYLIANHLQLACFDEAKASFTAEVLSRTGFRFI